MAETEEEQQQDRQTVTPPQERLTELLAQMREARRAYDASEIQVTDFYNRVIDIDRRLTLRLADNFNLRSGLRTALPESQRTEEFRNGLTRNLSRRIPADDIEQTFMDRIRRRAGASPDLFREENAEANGRLVVRNFIQNHPQLSGFTYEDAVRIAQDGMDDAEFARKYGGVDETVMASAVLVILELNKDRLKAEHPELQAEIDRTGLWAMGRQLMVDAPEDEEFKAWEEQKRQQIATAITGDKGLMRNIAALKPLLECTDERDFLRQHRLRESITRDMTDIYRRVYNIPELSNRNVLTVYAPLERAAEDDLIGHAGGMPGLRRDEFAVIRNSLYRELFLAQPTNSDRDITSNYLQSVSEELRHSVDLNYLDRLVNDKMRADDPAYRHTNVVFMNKFFYSDTLPDYSNQYLERTAKDSAAAIAEQVMDKLPEQSSAAIPAPAVTQAVTPATRN